MAVHAENPPLPGQVLPGFSLVFRFSEIKNNLPIEDAKFNKPTG